MPMAKTLPELAQEYLEQAQVQTRLIEKYRKRLSELNNPSMGREAYRTKMILRTLYEQRRDLIQTAYYLKNYYSDEKAA